MKRGVFMLIMKFIDDNGNKEKIKKRFYKKRKNIKNNVMNRYSINVNGKTVIVLELSEKDLQSEDVLTFLKIYKGRVLVPKKYANQEIIKEYLYNPKYYYQRTLLSSFINQIKAVNKEWRNICIKTEVFTPFKELFEIVKITKSVIIITQTNAIVQKFLDDCYYEFGAVVYVRNDEYIFEKDVYLDLDAINTEGKLFINVKGRDLLMYPDTSFFENCSEYQKLLPYNIEHNIICAAFSDK